MTSGMRAHKLKTWPQYFSAVRYLNKTCELRKADRDFRVGDYLMLIEYNPDLDAATGAYLCRRVTHILTAADAPRGLVDGFVILSLADCGSLEEDALSGRSPTILSFPPVEWIAPSPETRQQ